MTPGRRRRDDVPATDRQGPGPEAGWVEVRLPLPPVHARPLVVDALRRAGAALVETAPERPELSAWFPAGDRGPEEWTLEVRRRIRPHLPDPEVPLRTRSRDASHWAARWGRDASRIRISPELEIRPPGAPATTPASLELIPGPGFGTASHPTTRACLEALDRWLSGGDAPDVDPPPQGAPAPEADPLPHHAPPPANLQVLDVGSGSGILSVAAALLHRIRQPGGKLQVVGLEMDPAATDQARRLAATNGVGAVVDIRTLQVTPRVLDEEVDPADLVLCNLEGPLLLPLVPALGRRVRPGGVLVLSGIPTALVAEVRAQALTPPFRPISMEPSSGWWTLSLSRGSRRVSRGTGSVPGRSSSR